jgi:two-component system, LytTR family, response regulator
MEPIRISVRSNKGIRIIGIREIMYCEADGRYTRIFLENGESHLIAKVLREYEDLLPDENFFRIHKSCIVNLSYIKEYSINKHHKLILSNEHILPVAKRRCKNLVEKLTKFYPG